MRGSDYNIGIFDINGTIQDTAGVPPSVVEGFHQLAKTGIATTIATGRGLRRAHELLGDTWGDIVSVDMPISVENGGRLTTQNGQNLIFHRLSTEVIENTLGIIDREQSAIEFVGYYPKSGQDMVVWSPSGNVDNDFIQRHGQPGDVHSSSLIKLERDINRDEACMLIVKSHEPKLAEMIEDANVEINEDELNILNKGINKGRGVQDITELLGVPLHKIIVAGNDHNDQPMFNLAVGKRLFVGANHIQHSQPVQLFSTPAALGNYLKGAKR